MAHEFSVIIPTYQRRALVQASVRALAVQDFSAGFEVIVVVDGSTDGSAAALRAMTLPFRLSVLEQPNRGVAAARNEGAAAADGEMLLFLDDDMEAGERLLAEHDRVHRTGADVVFGHIPLHPESPANFLSANVGKWTDARLARLSAPGAALTLQDLLAGQMSLSRELFNHMGGFDLDFTAGGTFGNEDLDFGYRLMREGCHLAFNPSAVSWQYYDVHPDRYLRQWREAGRANVVFARKHPDASEAVFALSESETENTGRFWRRLVSLSPLSVPLMAMLRRLAVILACKWPDRGWVEGFFYKIWAMEYWRGVREAGGSSKPDTVRT